MKCIYALIIYLFLVTVGATEETRKYNHTYKGINVNQSTINEVRNILGREKEIDVTSNGKNYIFEEVVINISPPAAPAVNTISILGDKNYKFANGFKIGDDMKSVYEFKNGDWRHYNKVSVNYDKGFVYWYKDQKIYKIVMAGTLIDRRDGSI